MKRLAILLSGRGSNFAAILRNVQSGALAAEIVLVLSNRAEAKGLEIAREAGLHSAFLPSRGTLRAAFDEQLIAAVRAVSPDLICLAGYMRLLPPGFIEAFRGRILNIHPSLLPAFPGLDAQSQALRHGVKISGCTVHFVDEGLDSGPIVLQAAVPVLDADDESSLSARILAEEHRIYSEAIALVLQERVRIDGRRVLARTGQ